MVNDSLISWGRTYRLRVSLVGGRVLAWGLTWFSRDVSALELWLSAWGTAGDLSSAPLGKLTLNTWTTTVLPLTLEGRLSTQVNTWGTTSHFNTASAGNLHAWVTTWHFTEGIFSKCVLEEYITCSLRKRNETWGVNRSGLRNYIILEVVWMDLDLFYLV